MDQYGVPKVLQTLLSYAVYDYGDAIRGIVTAAGPLTIATLLPIKQLQCEAVIIVQKTDLTVARAQQMMHMTNRY
ncbi:Uncharacterized protein APZ42_020824 [Daphnia magna]|uniref:Uncharacterized protein n=1 Tax=Daphnia magna TaxID=35525 RepID=A0A164XEX2_9CRUS|nr:Uncharacterized protein APZ42_020824 [Daphnia magna]